MDTQLNRAYKLLKKAGKSGVYNHEFTENRLLRYSHYLKVLRDDYGHHITSTRLQLPNGRWTNVWVYRLEDEQK